MECSGRPVITVTGLMKRGDLLFPMLQTKLVWGTFQVDIGLNKVVLTCPSIRVKLAIVMCRYLVRRKWTNLRLSLKYAAADRKIDSFAS